MLLRNLPLLRPGVDQLHNNRLVQVNRGGNHGDSLLRYSQYSITLLLIPLPRNNLARPINHSRIPTRSIARPINSHPPLPPLGERLDSQRVRMGLASLPRNRHRMRNNLQPRVRFRIVLRMASHLPNNSKMAFLPTMRLVFHHLVLDSSPNSRLLGTSLRRHI